MSSLTAGIAGIIFCAFAFFRRFACLDGLINCSAFSFSTFFTFFSLSSETNFGFLASKNSENISVGIGMVIMA